MERRQPGEWRDGDGIVCGVSAFRDPKWRRLNGLPPVPPRKPRKPMHQSDEERRRGV